MSTDFDPHDDLTDRLRALGQRPIDPALQSSHLTAMAGVRGGSALRTTLAGRLKIGAGILGGFLLGATGLATAGALGPLQPIAADVVEAATPLNDLPESASTKAHEKAEKRAAKAAGDDGDAGSQARLEDGSIGTARIWDDGCAPVEEGGTVFAGNRGRYLSQERAKGDDALEAAKASDCGKPLGSTDDEGDDNEAREADDTAEEPGKATAPGQDGKIDDEQPGQGGDAPGESGEHRPTTVPSLPDEADDKADPPSHAPGTPAEPHSDGGDTDQ